MKHCRIVAVLVIAVLLAAALLGATGDLAPAMLLLLVGVVIPFTVPAGLEVPSTRRISPPALASHHLRAPPRRPRA